MWRGLFPQKTLVIYSHLVILHVWCSNVVGGLCQSAKLVCHETHNESTQHSTSEHLSERHLFAKFTIVTRDSIIIHLEQNQWFVICSLSTDSPRDWPVLCVDFCKKGKCIFCIICALGSLMWCWFLRRLQSHIDERSRSLSRAGTHRE